MEQPFISCVIPTFKEEKYIARCLSKLEQQTIFQDIPFEIVIADYDPDNLGLTKKAASYAPKSILKHVRWVNVPKRGIGYARHIGITNSTGRYIVNMDADAYFMQDYGMEYMIKPLENMYPNIVLTHCNNMLDDASQGGSEYYIVRNIALNLLMLPFVLEPGLTMPREIYDMSPGFRDIVAGEAPVLCTEIAFQHGFSKLLHINDICVLCSNRRIKTLQNKDFFQVFDYNTAFRGNDVISIL